MSSKTLAAEDASTYQYLAATKEVQSRRVVEERTSLQMSAQHNNNSFSSGTNLKHDNDRNGKHLQHIAMTTGGSWHPGSMMANNNNNNNNNDSKNSNSSQDWKTVLFHNGVLQSDGNVSGNMSRARSENSFPYKLYEMLEEAAANTSQGLSAGVSWSHHGRAFTIKDRDLFMTDVVPKFFKITKIRSFHRQCNLWGFLRILGGTDAWRHDSFVRGRPQDLEHIARTETKSKKDGHKKKDAIIPSRSPKRVKRGELVVKSKASGDCNTRMANDGASQRHLSVQAPKMIPGDDSIGIDRRAHPSAIACPESSNRECWQREGDRDVRRIMVSNISHTLCQSVPGLSTSEKLPRLAAQLEQHLYHSASSLKAYSDFSTLKHRLASLHNHQQQPPPAFVTTHPPHSQRQVEVMMQQQHQSGGQSLMSRSPQQQDQHGVAQRHHQSWHEQQQSKQHQYPYQMVLQNQTTANEADMLPPQSSGGLRGGASEGGAKIAASVAAHRDGNSGTVTKSNDTLPEDNSVKDLHEISALLVAMRKMHSDSDGGPTMMPRQEVSENGEGSATIASHHSGNRGATKEGVAPGSEHAHALAGNRRELPNSGRTPPQGSSNRFGFGTTELCHQIMAGEAKSEDVGVSGSAQRKAGGGPPPQLTQLHLAIERQKAILDSSGRTLEGFGNGNNDASLGQAKKRLVSNDTFNATPPEKKKQRRYDEDWASWLKLKQFELLKEHSKVMNGQRSVPHSHERLRRWVAMQGMQNNQQLNGQRSNMTDLDGKNLNSIGSEWAMREFLQTRGGNGGGTATTANAPQALANDRREGLNYPQMLPATVPRGKIGFGTPKDAAHAPERIHRIMVDETNASSGVSCDGGNAQRQASVSDSSLPSQTPFATTKRGWGKLGKNGTVVASPMREDKHIVRLDAPVEPVRPASVLDKKKRWRQRAGGNEFSLKPRLK